MSVNIISNTYTDIFGNVLTSYKANAGDKIVLTTTFETQIELHEADGSSISISLDFYSNEYKLLGSGSFLKEGFRIGDSITVKFQKKIDGTFATDRTHTITYVDDTTIRVASIGAFYIDSDWWIQIYSTKKYADLELNLNHIDNDSNASFNSLIDNEITTVKFSGLGSLSVSSSLTGSVVGNQSGQYLISSVVTRTADVGSKFNYTLVTTFIQSGIYNKDWFKASCLKLATKLKFFINSGEVSNPIEFTLSDKANTGWFNEPYNVEVVNSTLTSGIDTIYYNQATTTDIVVDSSATEIYLGACYISTDENRYKNKVSNQNSLSLLLNGYSALSNTTYTSNGGLYSITVNSNVLVGTVRTINITFTPLSGFQTLFESFDDEDKQFYIWLKVGNTNHLVFNGQLTKYIDTTLPLVPSLYTLLRHNNNTNSVTASQNVDKTNTEDNLAVYTTIPLPTNTLYDGFRFKIYASNSSTNEVFTLEEMFFSFASIQINSSGQYLIDITRGINNNLPNTSSKKETKLKLDLTTNTLSFYYPFLNQWQYWLTDSNISSDFYPNQNQNWVSFISGDWTIKTEISLENETAYIYSENLPISDYDSEPQITSEIKLYRSNGDLVTSLFDNEIMTIKATHNIILTTFDSSWGEITIENFEGVPQWEISTNVDADFNPLNPLSPITGTTATKNGTVNSVEISCLLDTSKISNSAKITSKIFVSGTLYSGIEFENGAKIQFEDNNLLEWEH